jgi:hypothetical protein
MTTNKTWYVEAVGHTNEVIAAELPAENTVRGVLCKDGKKRDFWICDYCFITKLVKSEQSQNLEFKVFYREGKYGSVRPWPFLRRRRRTTLATALKQGLVKKGGALLAPQ